MGKRRHIQVIMLIAGFALAAMATCGMADCLAQDTGPEPTAAEAKPVDKAAPPADDAQELAKKLSNLSASNYAE